MPRSDPLERLRAICLALPEATEKEAWGAPTFRVREKMFGMYVDNHHGDERIALWCKAEAGVQSILVGADPKRFFVPPYVGHKGWIGVRLDVQVNWKEVAEFAEDSYRLTAPARLSALLDQRQPNLGSGTAAPHAAREAHVRQAPKVKRGRG